MRKFLFRFSKIFRAEPVPRASGLCMDPSEVPTPQGKKRRSLLPCGCQTLFALGIFVILFGLALGPMPSGNGHPHENSSMQSAHALGLALWSFANDNNGNYPDGKSSTEVCQQLMDGGYVTDPTIFYLPMPGKVKATDPKAKLKPENVAWDVTAGVTTSSPGALPLLFATGYRVIYKPGAAAFARTDYPGPDWFGSSTGGTIPPYAERPGIAVFRVDNSARFSLEAPSGTSGSIPNFVPPDFPPDGKTYRQLTPEGVLAP